MAARGAAARCQRLHLHRPRLSHWKLEREPFPLETSLPGVFCAGDVRHDSIKRVSSGVGEGSMAIAFIHQYLALQNFFYWKLETGNWKLETGN
jgi:NADPH-dependent glutamate synthase beta subunit-like oxidoreductase